MFEKGLKSLTFVRPKDIFGPLGHNLLSKRGGYATRAQFFYGFSLTEPWSFEIVAKLATETLLGSGQCRNGQKDFAFFKGSFFLLFFPLVSSCDLFLSFVLFFLSYPF